MCRKHSYPEKQATATCLFSFFVVLETPAWTVYPAIFLYLLLAVIYAGNKRKSHGF